MCTYEFLVFDHVADSVFVWKKTLALRVPTARLRFTSVVPRYRIDATEKQPNLDVLRNEPGLAVPGDHSRWRLRLPVTELCTVVHNSLYLQDGGTTPPPLGTVERPR